MSITYTVCICYWFFISASINGINTNGFAKTADAEYVKSLRNLSFQYYRLLVIKFPPPSNTLSRVIADLSYTCLLFRWEIKNDGSCTPFFRISLMPVFPRNFYSSLQLIQFSVNSQSILNQFSINSQILRHNSSFTAYNWTSSNFYYSFKTNLQNLLICARKSHTTDGRLAVEVMV